MRTTKRTPYPSDVPDEVWRRIAPLLPPAGSRGRRRQTDLREVVNGINYRWTTGCTWRMLPHDFPPWETVYTYFRCWQRRGILPEVRQELLRRPRSSRKKRGLSSRPQQKPLWSSVTKVTEKKESEGISTPPPLPAADGTAA